MSSKRVGKQSKVMSYMKVPIRVVARSWDFYMKSMAGVAGPNAFGIPVGCPNPHILSFYSDDINTDEELRHLIRLTNEKRFTGKLEAPEFRRQKINGRGASVPRSSVVPVIGRIDEDKE